MKLAAGTMVNERVRLLEPLGRGAMGSVWLAEHLTLETEVAVKFIKPELADEDGGGLLDRFKREAKAAAQIKSPHVVQTLDHGFMEDDTPYIVMELLEGETLGERLTRSHRIRLRESAEIVSQVCRGLSKAHELGIVHRDIKPDNLFLIGEGEELLVKILDFGVAKQVHLPKGAATASGTLVGTPQYMSPEQLLRSEELGLQADLWALAVVAYQAMVGNPPFEGDTLAGIIVAITQAKFPRPSSIDERLAGAMDRWVDRALSLEPEARFATAKALADGFRTAVDSVQTGDPSLTTVDGELSSKAGANEPAAATASELAETAEFITEEALDVVSEAGRPDALTTETEVLADSLSAESAPSPPSGPTPAPVCDEEDDRESEPVEARTLSSRSEPQLIVERRGRHWASVVMAVAAVVGVGLWLLRSYRTDPPTRALPESSVAASAQTAVALPSTAALPVATTSSAAGSASASSARAKLPGRTVEQGRTPDDAVWLPTFRLDRPADDLNASYLEAQSTCRRRSMALCTEAQWLRACKEDTAVGAAASWTASAVADEGFVVRGGDGSCDRREIAQPADASPQRGGLCCSRVVGIRSSNRNPAFQESTATKLARIEQAFTTGNAALLSSLVGDSLLYGGSVMLRGPFVKRASAMFQLQPDGWLLHDICDVALFEEDGKHAWSADCGCVARQGTKLGHWLRRYVHDSTSGKIRSIEVPKVYRQAAPP